MAEPIKIQFDVSTYVGLRNYVLGGVRIRPEKGALLGVTVDIVNVIRQVAAAMRPLATSAVAAC